MKTEAHEPEGRAESAANEWPEIAVSPGLASWLRAHGVSLACSSYQTGQLFLVGANPNGGVNVDQQSCTRAMGLWANDDELWLGTKFQIWRFENVLTSNARVGEKFDRLYVPRVAHTTGSVDVHELGVTSDRGLVFVNTRFSCIAALDEHHSFAPVWKPPFISQLANEDRCHLNGLCIEEGQLRFVTAAGTSDQFGGWREDKRAGGVVMDVPSGEIVATGLSMPHSPRLHQGQLYALDSGRGHIVHIDLLSGKRTDVAFGQGFLRGLTFVGDYAVVGASKPRDKNFKGLELDAVLEHKKVEPWCAIMMIDMRTGKMAEWLRFDTIIEETFDVAALTGARCPMSVGIAAQELEAEITFHAPGLGGNEAWRAPST